MSMICLPKFLNVLDLNIVMKQMQQLSADIKINVERDC